MLFIRPRIRLREPRSTGRFAKLTRRTIRAVVSAITSSVRRPPGEPAEIQDEMLFGREVVVGAAQRYAGAVRDGAHRGRLVAALLEQVEGGAQDDRPRRLATLGFRGLDGQSGSLNPRSGLVRVVVRRHDDFLAERPAAHGEEEQVEKVHGAKDDPPPAQPRPT